MLHGAIAWLVAVPVIVLFAVIGAGGHFEGVGTPVGWKQSFAAGHRRGHGRSAITLWVH